MAIRLPLFVSGGAARLGRGPDFSDDRGIVWLRWTLPEVKGSGEGGSRTVA